MDFKIGDCDKKTDAYSTIELWIKIKSFGTNSYFSIGCDTNEICFKITLDKSSTQDELQWSLLLGSGISSGLYNGFPFINKWHHIAIITGSKVRLYLDGDLAYSRESNNKFLQNSIKYNNIEMEIKQLRDRKSVV